MKVLKFKDEKAVNFVDDSTLDSLSIIVSTFSELDAIKAEFEKADNLIGGTFDDEKISQRIYTGVTTTASESGNITATFTTREYTHDEVVDERLNDLEQVVAEM